MRGQKRACGGTPTRHDGERLVVVILSEPQAAVFPRNLDPEGSKLGQAIQHLLRYPAIPIDGIAINVGPGELLECLQEGLGPRLQLRVGLGRRIHDVQVESAVENPASEAPVLPLGLPRGFCDLPCLIDAREATLGFVRF